MPSLKHDMIHGAFWSGVQHYSGMVMGIVISMVLARILSPEEYGVVGIASVFIGFLGMFSSLGIGPAIIQRKNLDDHDLNSIFTYSLAIGAFLALLFFCSSWVIAAFYDNKQLVPVCQILSINLFFGAANMVPNALMSKDLRFKTLAKRSLILQFTSGVLAIFAAFNGAGVYALLIGPVISSIGVYLWNRYYYKLRVERHFDLKPIKKIFSFSIYHFLFDFVNYFSRNLDKIIIGKFMTLDALGIYEKSYRLMQMPMNNVTGIVNSVLLPVLKDLQDDKTDLNRKYVKIIRFISTISFPAGVILCCMAPEIIHFFYGGNWDGAIPVFSIMALSLPVQMILSTSGAIFMICDNTKMEFWVGIRNTVTTIVGFLIAAIFFKTIVAMACAWTITGYINFCFSYFLMYRYVLRTSILSMFKELVSPTITAIAAGALLYLLEMSGITGGLISSIMIKGTFSILLVFAIVQLSGRYDIIGTVKSKISTIKK